MNQNGTEPAGNYNEKLHIALREHPFTRGLKPGHLEVLASCGMLSEFKAGELIFREGELANRFYLLTSGEVALESVQQRNTDPVLIQKIGAGDVLGWSWLFPPYYWRFSARAMTDVKAIFLYGTRLQELSEQDHDIGYELMKRIASVVINRLQAARKTLVSSLNES